VRDMLAVRCLGTGNVFGYGGHDEPCVCRRVDGECVQDSVRGSVFVDMKCVWGGGGGG
jgi:hypothetical protein